MTSRAIDADSLRYPALVLAFAIPFALYLATLAPTVTLEDSGELIAAAYTVGVPHSPGYPLFTMLGKLFSLVPVGDVAYRLNLMSAFFSALAAMLLTWATAHVLGRGAEGAAPLLRWAAALAAGLWLATSFESWEQAIITEVYALNTAVFAVFLLVLARRWRFPAAGQRFLPAICLVLGLALTAHPTSLILIPLLALHVVRNDRGLLRQPRRLLQAALAFLAGVGPYLYLPLASARDPGMDWGNPETASNLFRTLFARHHRLRDWPSPGEYLERLGGFADLLARQWMPAFLLLAVIGLIAAFRSNRNFFWHAVALLLLAGPLVTLATNIDVAAADPRVAAENLVQVSVFYIPFYAVVAVLMGIGVCFVAGAVAKGTAARRLFAAAMVAAPLGFAVPTLRAVDMSDYRLAEDYADNLFAVVADGSVVLVDWDPFYFPLVYYQEVAGRRPDVVVLDRHLLRRSWYVEQQVERHPAVTGRAATEIDAFLRAVHPFEAGRPYDGRRIQRRYEEMLRALVDRNVNAGRAVYFAYDPPRSLTAGHSLESVGAAWRLARERPDPAAAGAVALRFRGLIEGRPVRDRFRRVFGDYYGRLSYELGAVVERSADTERALELYRRAARLLGEDHPLQSDVRLQIERVERQRDL